MKTSNSQVNVCCFLFKRQFVNVFTRDELGSMYLVFTCICIKLWGVSLLVYAKTFMIMILWELLTSSLQKFGFLDLILSWFDKKKGSPMYNYVCKIRNLHWYKMKRKLLVARGNVFMPFTLDLDLISIKCFFSVV